MQEEVQAKTLTVSTFNRSKGFRVPLEWLPDFLKWLAGSKSVVLQKEFCDACEGDHIYFLKPGEAFPICPNSMMICPEGHLFRYNKTEQKQRKEKFKIGITHY